MENRPRGLPFPLEGHSNCRSYTSPVAIQFLVRSVSVHSYKVSASHPENPVCNRLVCRTTKNWMDYGSSIPSSDAAATLDINLKIIQKDLLLMLGCSWSFGPWGRQLNTLSQHWIYMRSIKQNTKSKPYPVKLMVLFYACRILSQNMSNFTCKNKRLLFDSVCVQSAEKYTQPLLSFKHSVIKCGIRCKTKWGESIII